MKKHKKNSLSNVSNSKEIANIFREEIIHTALTQVLNYHSITVENINKKELFEILDELHFYGIFSLDGAVSSISRSLNISKSRVSKHLERKKRDLFLD